MVKPVGMAWLIMSTVGCYLVSASF